MRSGGVELNRRCAAAGEVTASRVHVRVERSDAVQVDHIEYLGDRAVRSGDAHSPTAFFDVAGATDQHPDSGAIDIVHAGEIDHQLANAFVNQAFETGFDPDQGCVVLCEWVSFEDGYWSMPSFYWSCKLLLITSLLLNAKPISDYSDF